MLDQEYVNNIPVTIDPSMDLIFKNLFGMKNNKAILIDFLNNILKRNNKNRIVKIKFINKELTGTNVIKDNNKKKRGRPKKKFDSKNYSKSGNMDLLVKNTLENNSSNSNNNEIDGDNYYLNDELKTLFTKILEHFYKIINEFKQITKIYGDDKANEIKNKMKEILNIEYKENEENTDDIFNKINEITKDKMDRIMKKILELMKPEENVKTMSIGATIKTGEIINIEVQMYEDPEIFKRSLFYASGIIFRSLPRGKKYNLIPNVIMINILKFNIFNRTEKEKNKLDWMFTLKENETNEQKGFKNLLNIHFIELKKFDDYAKENINDMRKNYPWILFLNNPNDDFFKKKDTPTEFINAREQLIYLQNDPEFMELYDTRSKILSDENSRKEGDINIGIKIGEEIGIKIGEEKGIKIGEERGIKVTIIEFALSLLKDKIKKESVMKHTKLSKEIVDILKDFLDNPDLTKFETIISKLKIDQNSLNKICENLEISINEKVTKKRKVN